MSMFQSASGGRHRAQRRFNGVIAMVLFLTSVMMLTGGALLFVGQGVDVVTNAPAFALVALGGAVWTAMILAVAQNAHRYAYVPARAGTA